MLTRTNRATFHTLSQTAVTLNSGDSDAPAIIYRETGREPEIISRSAFRKAVYRYAAALHNMGVRPRQLVIIAHVQNLESIYAFWGAMRMGAIPSMFPTLTEKLDPQIYMSNMAKLVELSDVKAVLTTDSFAPQLADHVTCPVYGSDFLMDSIASANTEIEAHDPEPDEIAFLQHSSGTTGLQKGIALSHTSVLNHLASYSDALCLDEQDVIVSWLPLYHDMGLIAGFLLPLVQGVPLILMSPFDWVRHPALLFQVIHDHRGTLCWLPNFAYNHSARRTRQRDIEGLSLASMRAFINCSEPVHHASHELFLERFDSIGVTTDMLAISYAMAENTFAVTQSPVGKPARLDRVDRTSLENDRFALSTDQDNAGAIVKVSCGPPVDGVDIRVVDDRGNILADRAVGEIAISGDSMLTGYYKRDGLDPFVDGWFLTGDRGYIAEGEVYVIGRSKDLIINAGKNIYPQDIEAIVNTVPGVHAGRSVVFGVPDEREGTELIAVVAEVTTEDADERKHIWQAIRQTVVRQTEVTVNYVHLVGPKWLIKTSSGKIARAANRDKWLSERNS